MHTKKELFGIKLTRYLKASKEEKSALLDDVEQDTGMHRKAIIRAFKRLQNRDPWKIPSRKRGPGVKYGSDVVNVLREVWTALSFLCAERLHPITAEYVRILTRDGMWKHSDSVTALLLQMSVGTMKRKIAEFQKLRRRDRNTTTKPGPLKELVPIRRGPWEDPLPGFGELDTVVHCGASLSGLMAYTVHYCDVATTWNLFGAQLGKGKVETLETIRRMETRLPFPLLGLDPDNGSEFLNWHLKDWCDQRGIELTRSRPDRKNDNALIEQKHYPTIRNFLGYRRIDTREQVTVLETLYAETLERYVNFFQPSVKCLKKERINSRYRRVYDTAQTPYRRVLEHKNIEPHMKDVLRAEYETLNPLKLKRELDRLVTKIFTLKKALEIPGESEPSGNS